MFGKSFSVVSSLASSAHRALQLSPPLMLMVLTLVALLLGLGTAQADPLDAYETSPSEVELESGAFDDLSAHCQRRLREAEPGLKWDYFVAACELYESGYDDVLALLPTQRPLIIDWYEYDDYRTHVVLEDPDDESSFMQISRALRMLDLSDEGGWGTSLLTCVDEGICRQSSEYGAIELVFSKEDGVVKLVRVTVENWEDEGC